MSNKSTDKRQRFRVLRNAFVLVLLVLAADLVFRIILATTSLGQRWRPMFDFWVVWEAASILVTAGVTRVYWSMYFKGDHAYARVMMRPETIARGSLAVTFGAIFLIVAAVAAFLEWHLLLQMLFLVVGVFGPVYLEHSVLAAVSESLRNAESKEGNHRAAAIRDVMSVRDDMLKFLIFSDLPILIAFICILIYVLLHAVFPTGVDTGLRAFVGGAVAIQLLYSNVVFLVENWTSSPWLRQRVPWVAYLDEMIEPRRY